MMVWQTILQYRQQKREMTAKVLPEFQWLAVSLCLHMWPGANSAFCFAEIFVSWSESFNEFRLITMMGEICELSPLCKGGI